MGASTWTSPKVSRAATRLEDAGLVLKLEHEEDRRLVNLSLPPAGQALMARLADIANVFQAELGAEPGPDAGPFHAALQRLMAGEGGDDPS